MVTNIRSICKQNNWSEHVFERAWNTSMPHFIHTEYIIEIEKRLKERHLHIKAGDRDILTMKLRKQNNNDRLGRMVNIIKKAEGNGIKIKNNTKLIWHKARNSEVSF